MQNDSRMPMRCGAHMQKAVHLAAMSMCSPDTIPKVLYEVCM